MYSLRIEAEDRQQGVLVPRPGTARAGTARPQSAQGLHRTSLPDRALGGASTSGSPQRSSPLQQFSSCGRLYPHSASGLTAGAQASGSASGSQGSPELAAAGSGSRLRGPAEEDLADAEFHDSDFEEDPPVDTTDDGSELIEFSAGAHDTQRFRCPLESLAC